MNEINVLSQTGRNWLPYGTFELPPGSMKDGSLEAWMQGILQPLALPADFEQKLLASARLAEDAVPEKTAQVRFTVFIPNQQVLAGQTWGFFQTARSAEAADHFTGGIHEVAFYLYVEGIPRQAG